MPDFITISTKKVAAAIGVGLVLASCVAVEERDEERGPIQSAPPTTPPPTTTTPTGDGDVLDAGPSPVTDHDAGTDDASAPPGACELESAWLRSATGTATGYQSEQQVSEPGMGGRIFRLVAYAEPEAMGPGESRLYLSRFIRGTMGSLGPLFVELGGCIKSGGLKGCTVDEPHELLWNGKTKDDLVIATMTQAHNPKYGYGSFSLVQIDPRSGAIVRRGGQALPVGGGPSSTSATHARVEGDDVHVFGSSNASFEGQTGSGSYFHMVFSGFMKKSCSVRGIDDVERPSLVERAAKPFERRRDE